jgi:hypothetical protein
MSSTKALNFIIPGDLMKTNEDLKSELVYNAESGNHRQFQYLRNYKEYFRARQIKRAHAILVASLRQSLNKQFKNYCKAIAAGETDVIKLLAYCTTRKVLSFYEVELNTINDMIIEYECYLANGNLFDFILGSYRPDEKLWDHRSL